ncbi:MAG: inlA 5 [Schlesneria sp.]|nr:inlA 5 [Schlesneria sp.]
MSFRLLAILIISMVGIVRAEDSTEESKAVAKIELLGGQVTRNDALPGYPVVGIKFGNGSRFGDKSAHFLSHVPHLTRLHLSGLQITDLCLREITKSEALTEVDLYKCPLVTDAGVQELMKLRNLTYLGCMNCEQISDEAVQGIENLTQLKTLYIGGVQFRDIGALRIDGLKELNELALSGQVTDVGLKAIARLPKLTILYLGGTQVTDACIADLLSLKHLKTLALDNRNITDAGVKEVVKLNELTTLHLGATKITDASMKELKTLRDLQLLDLCQTAISDDGLKELQGFPKLTKLRLDGCQHVTDVGVRKLQEARPHLRISR